MPPRLVDDLSAVCSALRRLASETHWPETKQGVAVQVLTHDLAEFCEASVRLFESGSLSPAMYLLRGITERGRGLAAASYDRRFAHRYVEDQSPLGSKRMSRSGDALTIIRRIAADAGVMDEVDQLTAALLEQLDFGSGLVHPGPSVPAIALGDPDEPGIAAARHKLLWALGMEIVIGAVQVAFAAKRTAGPSTALDAVSGAVETCQGALGVRVL
jgi:hypothetical protein